MKRIVTIPFNEKAYYSGEQTWLTGFKRTNSFKLNYYIIADDNLLEGL